MKAIGCILVCVLSFMAFLLGCIAWSNKYACEKAWSDLATARQFNNVLLSKKQELETKLYDSEFNAEFFQKETASLMKDREHFQKLYWDKCDEMKKLAKSLDKVNGDDKPRLKPD